MTDMVAYADVIPNAGETLVGNSFVMGFGGKGANQAVMAKSMGAQVSMVNSVGTDLFGDSTLKNFQDQGISTEFVSRAPGSSGIAPIWVDKNGNNRIIIIPGANNLMTPQQAQVAVESLKNIDILIGQLEIPQEVTAAAFEIGKKKGITTILNPAPYVKLSPELLQYTDWLIPNESEFTQIHPQNKNPNEESIKELSQLIGTKLIVTLGEAGAGYIDPTGQYKQIAAPKVSAIDTTGAGDAFVGAFAYGLAVGFNEEKAIKLACICASDSVTRKGTQSSYPSEVQTKAILESL